MAREKVCGIYCIENLVDHKRYIGLSKDIYARFRVHKYKLNSNKHVNNHLQKAWNKYGGENFNFTILELCAEDLLKDKEKFYINKYNSLNRSYGYNKTSGGDGLRDLDDDSRNQISLNETLYPVVKLDLDGTYVCEYRNCNFAANDVGGSKKNIYRCCINPDVYKTAYGFIWIYKKDYDELSFNIDKYKKKICGKSILQYDLNMNFIAEYESAHEAERITGIGFKMISRVCNGYRPQTHGFIFEFKN